MKADLHLHTHYSDGSDSPREVFRLAKKNEVRLISITDHDTLEGRDEFRKLSNEFHVDYIPGVEVSAFDYERNRPCHIIGLNVQSGCKEFEQMIGDISKQRHQNSEEQIQTLTDLGYPISLSEVKAFRGERVIYKQHIMDVLIQKAVTKELYGEFYQHMFKNGGPLDKKINYPSAKVAITLLKKAGAIPVLAHPTLYKNLDGIKDLVDFGLEGIEINYPFVKEEEQKLILQLAKQYQLKLSGGSDYHGTYADHSIGSVGSFTIDLNQSLLT